MAHQAWLDVLRSKRLTQERVVEKVDLAHRAVVGGPPVGIEQAQIVLLEHGRGGHLLMIVRRRQQWQLILGTSAGAPDDVGRDGVATAASSPTNQTRNRPP